jgi:predicted ATPase
MSARLKSIRIQNYRSLADVSLDLGPINVLFGPSGAGKSSLLDAIRFFRDCVFNVAENASAKRGHGIGLLFDGAPPGDPIRLMLATEQLEYELTLGRSAGRIDPLAGERLYSLDRRIALLEREVGTSTADLFDARANQMTRVELREPTRLSLDRFLDLDQEESGIARGFAAFLLTGSLYHSRSLDLDYLKEFGSPSGFEHSLMDRGSNLWSVLRILDGRRQLDGRYETIMRYMSEAFPAFKGLVIEPTAPTVLYASLLEQGRREPVLASGMSDGHLQFLILLTALFHTNRGQPALVLFDEPEASLHPWALAVFAKAIREATASWGRQVVVATQSPALISEFDRDEQLAVESQDGRTRISRVSEIEDIRDLLEDYSTGTLYMTESVAPQGKLVELSTSGQ